MRIAIATVGTTGDIRPFVALARRLVERGHAVTAVSWPVHRAALAQPGVRVEVAGPHADAERIAQVAAEAATRTPLDQVSVLRDFHLADGEAHYRQLSELLPGHDLVLLHGIHALAHAVALDHGLRWATAVFDPVLLPTATAPPPGMPNLGPLNRLLWRTLDSALARAGRPLDGILEGAGSVQRGLPLFRARSPLLHLVACSPTLVRVPADLPPTTHITGAWTESSAPAPLPPAVESFLAAAAPPIVITFGSMAGLAAGVLDDAIARILGGGRRVLVQATTASADPGLLAVTEPLDHRALFPRARLVVHHGGSGTTHAAVGAGIPSVVVPQVGDQRYWADRLWDLGVAPRAVTLRGLTGATLAESVLAAAADPRLGDRASELGRRVRAEDGIGRTIALLEAVSG